MFLTVNEYAVNRNALNRRPIGNGNSLYVNSLPALTTLIPDSPIDCCAMSFVKKARLSFSYWALYGRILFWISENIYVYENNETRSETSLRTDVYFIWLLFFLRWLIVYSLTRCDTLIPTEIKRSLSISRSRVWNVCPLILPPSTVDTSHSFQYAKRMP